MSEEDQPVGFLSLQHLRVALLLLLAVLRVADQHVVAFASRRVLDAFENEREERIGDVGNRDDHLAGAHRPQVFRNGVRCEAEALDRLQHFPASPGCDDVRMAQDTGNRCGRNAGALSDFVNGCHR